MRLSGLPVSCAAKSKQYISSTDRFSHAHVLAPEACLVYFHGVLRAQQPLKCSKSSQTVARAPKRCMSLRITA